jgi:hypothetical protein
VNSSGSGSGLAEIACVIAVLAMVLVIVALIVAPKLRPLEQALGLANQVTTQEPQAQ